MEASERDSTDEWAIPESRGPLLIGEIEGKVDVAIAIARAAEEGVQEVGEAAIDAAKQALRAAEMAEAASAAAAEARDAVATSLPPPQPSQSDGRASSDALSEPAQPPVATEPRPPAPPLTGEARMRRFTERCERVSARLRALERRPGSPAAASAAEAPRRRAG